MGRDVHSLTLSIKHFSADHGVAHLPRCFGEAVVACDMPETCECPPLGGCWKRVLWAHKEVGTAAHPVFGLVLQVGEVSSESLDHFLGVSKQGPCLTAIEQDGDDKRLLLFELACQANGDAKLLVRAD